MGIASALRIRPLRDDEREWSASMLSERWASPIIVRRAAAVDAGALAALVAEEGGTRVGLLTYLVDTGNCEIVTLDAVRRRAGVGTALLEAVAAEAVALGCVRLFLVTTNDNLGAFGFYQKMGFRFVAVHHDAVASARGIKASIPELGEEGIPVTDELELERWL